MHIFFLYDFLRHCLLPAKPKLNPDNLLGDAKNDLCDVNNISEDGNWEIKTVVSKNDAGVERKRSYASRINHGHSPADVVLVVPHLYVNGVLHIIIVRQWREACGDNDTPHDGGYIFELPGGKMNKEYVFDTATREVFEETPVRLLSKEICTVSSFSSAGITDETAIFIVGPVAPKHGSELKEGFVTGPTLHDTGENIQSLYIPAHSLYSTLEDFQRTGKGQVDARLLAFALGMNMHHQWYHPSWILAGGFVLGLIPTLILSLPLF